MTINLISALAFLAFLYRSDVNPTPAGQKYRACIRVACKDMVDGGCSIYTYQILNFSQDSVTVSYEVVANCSPKERERGYNRSGDDSVENYKWSKNNDTITIEGYDEYGKINFNNSTLTGEEKSTKRRIEFKEVSN